MKLKNIGEKIVNVGATVVMPGEEASFPDSVVDTPAMHVLAGLGFIELVKEEVVEPKEEAVPETKAEEESKEEEPAKEQPAKRGRKAGKTSK